jgi:adenylate cyclase
MVLGIERVGLAIAGAAIGVSLVIALQFTVPYDTGAEPVWFVTAGFIINTISAGVLAVAIVWYGLRQIASAEAAMEQEYARSEALLANILPASVAERLKDGSRSVIADKYDDASILFADIAGYTERASDTSPEELVAFLDGLYTQLDALVTRHGLEKIKTSGDAVNVASRMESTAVVGRIQVPQAVYERLSNRFVFEERGDVDVKGKGAIHTWYLVGRHGQREQSAAGQRSAAL